MASIELKEKAFKTAESLCKEYRVDCKKIETHPESGLDVRLFGVDSNLRVLMAESIYHDAYRVKVINITGSQVSEELIVRV